MIRSMLLAVAFVAVAGCASPAPSGQPVEQASSTLPEPLAIGSPSPPPTGSATTGVQPSSSSIPVDGSAGPTPTWAPEPTRDDRFVPIEGLTFSHGRSRITLDFVGAKPYAPDDPCSAAYKATTRVVDGALEVGLYQSKPNPSVAPNCDTIGYGRHLVVDLAEPFTGTVWRDRSGPYIHFLAPPDGLVRIPGLPAGWLLRSGTDVEESLAGRWQRTWAPEGAGATREQTLVLYQSFGGPVNVTGGDDGHTVTVNGAPATLYRYAPTGELVLVWRLGDSELALVAYEQTLPESQLIQLAESVVY